MSRTLIFNQSVNGTVTFDNMPERETVLLQCNGDVTVSWWDDVAAAYNTGELVSDPGGRMDCPAAKVRFVTASAVVIKVIPFEGTH
jgi:hypothetical protein